MHHACAEISQQKLPLRNPTTRRAPEPLVDALQERLKELGYRDGHNIAYEYRWAEGKLDRLNELAKELVALKVDVITTLSTPAAIAAQKATQTIPIVFT